MTAEVGREPRRISRDAGSEERVAAFPPMFELGSRCTGCGLILPVRRAFDRLD